MRTLCSILLCCHLSLLTSSQDTLQKVMPGRTNSALQQQKPYLILISIDGFRYDYPEKHGAPHLLSLVKHGVRAASMIPGYPSLTFPNHYSIVTGLYPSHHGLSSNYFYSLRRQQFYSMKDTNTVRDGSWYGGTPLWVLAEQQQMLSASFFWVGSEAAIRGVRPTYYYRFYDKYPMDRRIQAVVDWLSLPPSARPHFITFYISDVDHAGHDFGPDAPETKMAVQRVDSIIYRLVTAVGKTGLPVNFIVVGDHGMTRVDNHHGMSLPAVIDSSKFFIPRGFELVELYARNKDDVSPVYQQLLMNAKDYKVYLKKNMPARLHYNDKDDRAGTIGDMLLIPKWPKIFSSRKDNADPGAHGFDPYLLKDMHTIFMAWGPAFKKGIRVPSFENVNVYPVIAKILGLHYDEKIDGSETVAQRMLNK
jgi:predicted AlkP superfamily pyrophosphatase or phosphodiesterase